MMTERPQTDPERFTATYLVETAADVESVAVEMAGEQSTSTSRRVVGETAELVARHGARIERIDRLEDVPVPSLPVTGPAAPAYHRARVVLSWPVHNIGRSLTMLGTALMGNQTGMKRLSGLRLEDISLPASFMAAFPRPAFGIEGTRRLTGVSGRPVIGSVIKPNIGLTPEQTAETVRQLATAGVDFIKDDELMADPPYSPLERRVAAVMPVIRDAAQRLGRQPMYAFNITGDADEMRRNHDLVLAAGGTCVMVNVNSVGLAGLVTLRRHSQLPIHAHRAGWGAMTRCPLQGLDFAPYQAMLRLAGVDQLHVSGLGGKFWETEDSVLSAARCCLTPLVSADDRAMPVFSGGSTVRDVEPTYHGISTTDILFVCGSAIFSHPMGIAAGYSSIRAAWDAAIAGKDLEGIAAARKDLAAALEFWPRRR